MVLKRIRSLFCTQSLANFYIFNLIIDVTMIKQNRGRLYLDVELTKHSAIHTLKSGPDHVLVMYVYLGLKAYSMQNKTQRTLQKMKLISRLEMT